LKNGICYHLSAYDEPGNFADNRKHFEEAINSLNLDIIYMKKNQQKSDDISLKIKNPKWTAKTGIICGVISIFFFPLLYLVAQGRIGGSGTLGIFAPIFFGTIGIYYGIKQKAEWKIIFLNVFYYIRNYITRCYRSFIKNVEIIRN